MTLLIIQDMNKNSEKSILTDSTGCPIDDNQNSMTAGENGPILLQDFHLIDKLAAFDRERIPERVVHAKGAGAHGYFEVTHDVSQYCKAKFLDTIGKKTPVLARFSTVGGEKGSADTERDPRGFAVKFYTEEGNWDMVGNNTPVFFIRDPIKFPDFIHTQKRNPQSNCKDPDAFWDFFSLSPESLHQVTILFSDYGTPYGYRHMHGYGSHTFRWVNSKGEGFFVKWHFKAEAGSKNFTASEADEMRKTNPDFATQDLFDHIQNGGEVAWRFKAQIMPEAEASNYKWNVLDVTKVWPHSDYPLKDVGRLVLNKNPQNYHAEIEQAAFSPGHLVPGIEPSFDKMLQGRLFSYPDTHRHRLGANHKMIPVNCPYNARVHNNHRDGFAVTSGPHTTSHSNYEPNSFQPYTFSENAKISPTPVCGFVGRFKPSHPNSDFEQAGDLYRKVMKPRDRQALIDNIVGHLKNAKKFIQQKQVNLFYKCDPEYGTKVAEGLGITVQKD